MIKDSLLEVLATRASVELARVAAVRPALGKALRAGRGHSWRDTWRRHARL